MTIDERIDLLAPVVSRFPAMGDFGNAASLRELVETEWLDGMIPPRRILHIISANTAMAGMQSLVRGLILGSENTCKTPGVGLPLFEEFIDLLPPELGLLVKISRTLPEEWLIEADAVIVFGNDETVANVQQRMRNDQIFAGYGNRWSGAVIFSDPDFSSIPGLVQDVCLYNQMGCLSTQIVWLHESIDAEAYGKRLAEGLAEFVAKHPVATLNLEESASIARWRLSAEWRAVEGNRVWLSTGEPVWAVLLTDAPNLSCLHRHVSLVTFSDRPDLGQWRESVSTLGVWPVQFSERLIGSGASRICPVGEMQFPHPTWQQDGHPALGRLLRRVGQV